MIRNVMRPGYLKIVCEQVGIRRFVQMTEQPAEDASRAGRRMGGMVYLRGKRESTGP